MFDLKCVACIVEAKMAAQTGVFPPGSGPSHEGQLIRPAVAILNGQTTCAEHIVIHQQSPLSAPNGSPVMRQVR